MGSHALITVFIYLLYLHLAFSQLPPNQVSTMTSVYQIFQNNTGSNFVWNNIGIQSNPCSWRGVTCTPDNTSISQLSFQSFQLSTSEFLPILCQIDTLQSLDVSYNRLTSIPDEFFVNCGEISGLRRLNFSMNGIDGTLPTFNGFRQLEFLDFFGNSLSGNIGSQLMGLDELRSLNLSRNRFSGSIPTNLGRAGLLEELQLSWNAFTDEIPLEIITRYRSLSLIDLSLNSISGSIPEELGRLTRLQVLVLSLNNLSRGIPNSLSNLTALFRFAANRNRLNGTIPNGIASYLSSLDLSYNDLTGTIPSSLLSGPNLQSLDLSYNELEGQIPGNISTSLFRLRLGSNSLDGMLPAGAFGNLAELTYLELDNNSFSGPIPSELGTCRNLALLNLAQNRFTGLPSTLGNLTNLQVLSLQSNNLVGEIPETISQLNKLERLNLSRNLFNGSIPPSISRLRSLTNLGLEGNNLSGEIPNTISRLTSLIELQLGNNQLGGTIPDMPPYLNIELNLSHNHFIGSIPLSLSRLLSLEVLDLSDNNFSGQIPIFLPGMSSLIQLNLSNNQLSGILPRFGPHVVVDTEGNINLTLPSSNPTLPSGRRRSLSTNILIAFATASLVVILMISVAFFVSRRYSYRINDENSEENDSSPPHIIHGHLLTPNSIHRSNIDFAKAMEAVSDPSNTISKTRFSTYYKSVMPSGASYFVKKLNWVDEKIFQFGGNEKFGKEMEILAKLGNSNIMVPLAYAMTVDSAYLFYNFFPKGTLFDVLHGVMGNSGLDWGNRYSIAIGVAQGLSFLHGSNSGPILLLDLSSKSILVKSTNEAQIGDIELCKVIDPLKSSGSISTVAGSVGYIPPEYAYTMRVTAAGNVYSFGVVLLELLTGKPAVSKGTELAKWVLSNSMHHNKWDQILDFSVIKTSIDARNQMLSVLKVALACVSVSPDARPKIKSVLRMLLNAR